MILVEEILKTIFEKLPVMTIGGNDFKPRFDFGTKEDLLKFMNENTTQKKAIYPLIWLETPITKTGSDKKIDFPCRLILATQTNATKKNIDRLEVTFKTTLVPLYTNVFKALNQSGRTKILDKDNIKRTDFYNYGLKELSEEKSDVTSKIIWDAIKIECKLQVNNSNCPIEIIY